jgi:Family of unknown function (DUF6232)
VWYSSPPLEGGEVLRLSKLRRSACPLGDTSRRTALKGTVGRMSHVNVRISRRVLWIGGDAYPLQNVARAATIRGKFGSRISDQPRVLGCLLPLLFFALVMLSTVMWWGHWYALAIAPWALIVLALVARAMKKPVYSLVIETSGSSCTVLTSTNKDYLDRIVWEIMSAIDNPGAEYRGQV